MHVRLAFINVGPGAYLLLPPDPIPCVSSRGWVGAEQLIGSRDPRFVHNQNGTAAATKKIGVALGQGFVADYQISSTKARLPARVCSTPGGVVSEPIRPRSPVEANSQRCRQKIATRKNQESATKTVEDVCGSFTRFTRSSARISRAKIA